MSLRKGFPSGSAGKESTRKVGEVGQEDPLEKSMQPTLVFFPGESHGQRSQMGCNP